MDREYQEAMRREQQQQHAREMETEHLRHQLNEAVAQLAAANAQRDELVKACTAKDDLLVCYRIGKQPSDTLFKRLDRAKKVLDAIAAEQPKPAGGAS